jgi:hypothetical protein
MSMTANEYAGEIVVNRVLLSHEIWTLEKHNWQSAWIELLLLANDRDRAVHIHGHRVELRRGQLCWSLRSLGERWKWNKGTVRRFLDYLIERGMVAYTPGIQGEKAPIITIQNYSKWQPLRTQNGHTVYTGRTVTGLEEEKEEGNFARAHAREGVSSSVPNESSDTLGNPDRFSDTPAAPRQAVRKSGQKKGGETVAQKLYRLRKERDEVQARFDVDYQHGADWRPLKKELDALEDEIEELEGV